MGGLSVGPSKSPSETVQLQEGALARWKPRKRFRTGAGLVGGTAMRRVSRIARVSQVMGENHQPETMKKHCKVITTYKWYIIGRMGKMRM